MPLLKESQSSFSGPSLSDLIAAIGKDPSISHFERLRLIDEIKRSVPSISPYTPLSQLMYNLGGGILGDIIAKYFGMGLAGRAVSSFVGAGLGSMMYNRMAPTQLGWKKI